MTPTTLLIACGALAQEITALIRVNRWDHMAITCVPAQFHNRPEKITGAVREKIAEARGKYDQILVVYGDCGTGGELDVMLAEEGVMRIAGPHCYQFYAGQADFEAMMEAEPGSFFLTDYLVRHFDLLMIQGLGLDRHPQLRDEYFGNYSRLIYLAQTENEELAAQARAAADKLGLAYEYRYTGYGELERFMAPDNRAKNAKKEDSPHGKADHRLLA